MQRYNIGVPNRAPVFFMDDIMSGGGERMTGKEVSELYNIPAKILKEYERWEMNSSDTECVRQYDAEDLERLSLIISLLYLSILLLLVIIFSLNIFHV